MDIESQNTKKNSDSVLYSCNPSPPTARFKVDTEYPQSVWASWFGVHSMTESPAEVLP